jgi:hypothetical protein
MNSEDNALLTKYENLVENFLKAGNDTQGIKTELNFLDEETLNLAIANVRQRTSEIYYLVDPYVISSLDQKQVSARWYAGPSEHSVRWEFAKKQLIDEGRSEQELSEVLTASAQILGQIASPSWPSFSSRGLVLGYVQSGKTTNFISTIAQAADAGYRLIIVLSGVTNNLRKQTQERLERSLTGKNPNNWYWLTSEESDFNESKNANEILSTNSKRVIAVIKKNNSRLKKLEKWLKTAPSTVLHNLPVLIIDDEADQATINSHRQRERQTAINLTLTNMLKPNFLPKNSYLGYTATPFANILSDSRDPNQLFPRDFIYPLKRPEKYFGAEQLFGRDPIDEQDQERETGRNLINEISLTDKDHLSDLFKTENTFEFSHLPKSLIDAVNWFLVATAARRIRSNRTKFSTMLIHTSGRISDHQNMQSLVSKYVEHLRNQNADRANSILREAWMLGRTQGWLPGDSPILEWSEIEIEAAMVLRTCKIIVDNSRSDDRLNYDFDNETTANPYIVIGGNTLARGLTLEGLISSYFLRTSSAYDSLLQMGRWFGYRVGYEDLQRIWMEPDMKLNFRYMALVEEEIRSQISNMAKEGLTPSRVPIKIRDHKLLTITALNKMTYAKQLQIGYSDTRVETISFETHVETILHNQEVTKKFISNLADSGIPMDNKNPDGWPIFYDVPWMLVKKYFENYSWSPNARVANGELITKYVDHHQGSGDLENWNVFIYQINRNVLNKFPLGHGIEASLINRSAMDTGDDNQNINIHHLVSSIDGSADVGLTKIEVAKLGPVSDASMRILREKSDLSKKRGLLGIYLIDKNSQADPDKPERKNLKLSADLVGLGIFFGEASVEQADLDYFGPDLSEAIDLDEDDYLDTADKLDEDQKKYDQ